MSQISAENLTLCDLTIAFWQGSCVFTSNNLGFADFICCKLINHHKVCKIIRKTSNTVVKLAIIIRSSCVHI